MRELFRVCAAVAAIATALPLGAQQAAEPAKAQAGVMDAAGAADVAAIRAKIEAIDVAKRLVSFEGPLGRVLTVKVDAKVKNLAEVKVGDVIVLKYVQAVSVALAKDGAGRSETTVTSAPATAPAGAKPGMAMAQQTRIVAKVESVDPHRRMALLQGPNGNYVEVKVKDPNVFKDIKAGDNVDVTYTEAVVVDVVEVVPPAAKK